MNNFYNCLCGESFLGNNCERGNFKTSFFFKFLNLNLLINWPSCLFSGFNSIHLLSYFLYSCCQWFDFHVLFEFSIFISPLIPKSGLISKMESTSGRRLIQCLIISRHMAIILQLVTKTRPIIREIGGLEDLSTDLTYPQYQDNSNQEEEMGHRQPWPPQLS